MRAKFQLASAASGFSQNFSKVKQTLNLVCKIDLEGNFIMINGFNMDFDSISKDAMASIPGDRGHVSSEQSKRVMMSLLEKDVISINS